MKTKKEENRAQINFRIPKDEKALLETLAKLENRSVSQYLRNLYLKAQHDLQTQKAA